MTQQCTPEILSEMEMTAREMLAKEYEECAGEGPYPSYADLARRGKGEFTMRSIRAIAKALSLSSDTTAEITRLRTTIKGQALALQDSSAALAMVTKERDAAREALKPFAAAASAFLFSLGPDGIDDGLTVDVSVACRPERETTLSTTDFSNAAAAIRATPITIGDTGTGIDP